MQNPRRTQIKKIVFVVIVNILVLLYVQFGRTDEENYQRGVEAYQDKNYSKAFNIMSSLADKEHVGAQTLLSTLYAKGQGVEADKAQSTFWSEKAAQHKKDVQALTNNSDIPLD